MPNLNSNNQYRDSVFRDFFKDKIRLLSLCNALLDTNYDDPEELTINNFEGIFLSNVRNDISCKIRDQYLVLIEHQTSINENMPFRCLAYAVKLLESEIPQSNKIYRRKRINFPAPKFFVLYDGDDKDEPLKREMRLSDAFGGDSSSLELVLTSFNINKALNSPLLKKSVHLNDYATLIGEVKKNLALGLNLRQAIIKAVHFCIDNNIMSDYLDDQRKDVFELNALEWNMEDALKANYEDGFEDGIEQVVGEMLRRGRSVDEIHDFAGFPIEMIKKVAKSI